MTPVNQADQQTVSGGRLGWRAAIALHLCTALCIVVLAAPAPAEDNHDFGTVIRGCSYSNTFFITNGYASALHVTQVRTLCPCIKTLTYDAVIPPGGTGRVSLLLDTAKLFEGKVRYATMVHLTTNAVPPPAMPGTAPAAAPVVPCTFIRQMEMRATVVDDVAIVPASKDVGRLAAGQHIAPFQVDVYSRTSRRITTITTTATPSWLGAAAMPFAADSAAGVTSRWRIVFACTNAPPIIGPLDVGAMFTVSLTNESRQTLPTSGQYTVRIKGVVEPVFSPQPPLIVIAQVAVSGSVEHTVAFAATAGAAMHITGTKSSGTAVKVATLNTNDPRNVSIVLRTSPDHVGMIDETVTVTTDNEAQHEVSLRVLGNAR